MTGKVESVRLHLCINVLAAIVSSEECVQLMEECLHLFPSTTKGLLKTAFPQLCCLSYMQIMNHTLWEVKIVFVVDVKESKCSCILLELKTDRVLCSLSKFHVLMNLRNLFKMHPNFAMKGYQSEITAAFLCK